MIKVSCNIDNYAYDIHSLVKAFYPQEDVKVVLEDNTLSSSCDRPELFVRYGESDIRIDIRINGELVDSGYSDGIDINDRPVYKNELKILIYSMLVKLTGRELPWGTLTGIRPTKIAVSMIEEGHSDEEVLRYYDDVYRASAKKTKLAIDIAHREINILKNIHYDQGYSLYIGIPFCPTTCLYCSFTSFPRGLYEKKVAQYIECLKKEIDYVSQAFADKTLDSIYIGGGTPTTLLADELKELIGYIQEKLDTSRIQEFTVEAGRPDSITRDKLEVLASMGVTRISVNPQTFKQETLDIIGRRHTVEQVIDTYKMAREVGLDNINMDLIMGLPGETADDIRHTLDMVGQLKPDSVTIHSLAIKRASRLNSWIEEHGIEMLQNTDEIMEMTQEYLPQLGLNPYYLYRQKNMSGNFENVGYAAQGKEGIYNILIMEEKQSIVALGAGTVTKRVFHEGNNYRMERCDNVKDVNLYISKIEEMIDRKRQLFAD